MLTPILCNSSCNANANANANAVLTMTHHYDSSLCLPFCQFCNRAWGCSIRVKLVHVWARSWSDASWRKDGSITARQNISVHHAPARLYSRRGLHLCKFFLFKNKTIFFGFQCMLLSFLSSTSTTHLLVLSSCYHLPPHLPPPPFAFVRLRSLCILPPRTFAPLHNFARPFKMQLLG